MHETGDRGYGQVSDGYAVVVGDGLVPSVRPVRGRRMCLSDEAEVGSDPGFPGPVAGFPVPGQGLLEVAGGPLVPILPVVDDGEAEQRGSLRAAVTCLRRGIPGVAADADGLSKVPADVEVAEHGCGQPGGM